MRRFALLALLVLAGCGESDSVPADRAAAPAPDCHPARVNSTPYPGPGGAGAWIEAEPRSTGLTAVLGYWPKRWRDVTQARVVTGGVMPQGWSTKTMWIFLGRQNRGRGGPELVIDARNLTGPGTWRESFAEIRYEGQNGAPSYASIIDLPNPGCWRLTLTTGDLKATVDLRAVRASRRRA